MHRSIIEPRHNFALSRYRLFQLPRNQVLEAKDGAGLEKCRWQFAIGSFVAKLRFK